MCIICATMVDRPVQPVFFENPASGCDGTETHSTGAHDNGNAETNGPEDGGYNWKPAHHVAITSLAILETFLDMPPGERVRFFGSTHALVKLDDYNRAAANFRADIAFANSLRARGLPPGTSRERLKTIVDAEHDALNKQNIRDMLARSDQRRATALPNKKRIRRLLTFASFF